MTASLTQTSPSHRRKAGKGGTPVLFSAMDGMLLAEGSHMKVQYLEIVTPEVDPVCAAYAAALGVEFGEPLAELGGARTASCPGGGLVGVRPPLRETEDPVVRPYWLVEDIEAAVAAAAQSGGEIALPPMEIPGHGTCAIYLQGGIQHGLWQL